MEIKSLDRYKKKKKGKTKTLFNATVDIKVKEELDNLKASGVLFNVSFFVNECLWNLVRLAKKEFKEGQQENFNPKRNPAIAGNKTKKDELHNEK